MWDFGRKKLGAWEKCVKEWGEVWEKCVNEYSIGFGFGLTIRLKTLLKVLKE